MDSTTREKLIGLGAAIQRKRDELAALEQQFDSLAASGSGAPPPVAPQIPAVALVAGQAIKLTRETEALFSASASLPQKILARMRLQSERLYDAEDFKDLVDGESGMANLRSALQRLYDGGSGPLDRPERGKYKLKSRPGSLTLSNLG